MLHINGNKIKLTRGDTAFLTVPMTTITGETYEMTSGDTLILSIKENIEDFGYLLQKRSTGNNVIHIEPRDTKNIPFGKYKYDIQLNKENGDIYTLIDVDIFEIMQEVTC